MRLFFKRGEKQRLKQIAKSVAPALVDAFMPIKISEGTRELIAGNVAELVKPASLFQRMSPARARSEGYVDASSGKIAIMPGGVAKEFVGRELTHEIMARLNTRRVGGLDFIPSAVGVYLKNLKLKKLPSREDEEVLHSFISDFHHVGMARFGTADEEKLKRVEEGGVEHGVRLGLYAKALDKAGGSGTGLFFIARISDGASLREAEQEVLKSEELRQKIREWREKHSKALKKL
jgi:hypothetical protein